MRGIRFFLAVIVLVAVVAATGSAATMQFKEAPMLAAMVAKGQLPPVEQRLPKNPKVAEMIEGIGKYGGDLIVYATNENIWENDLQGQMGSSLFRIPRNGIGIEPDLATSYQINADRTAVTVFLREGLKWSDGFPLTSEDIRFTFEDMHFWLPAGQVRTFGPYSVDAVKVVDDYAINLISPEGLGVIPMNLSDWYGGFSTTYQPAHYLKKWHIKYNPDAQTLAKSEKFDQWYLAMYAHYNWAPLTDVNKPQIEPWKLTEYSTTAKVMVRNPYFWRVDPAGNQLPYADRVVIQIVSPEVYQLKVTSGSASIAYYQTKLENIPLYKTNAAAGDYKVTLFPAIMSANLKYVAEGRFHKDPAIRKVFEQLDFRRALSVALNRQEVNSIIYQGLGVPGKVAPLESVSYYQKGWRTDWAQYDPKLANELLDKVGLDKKDKDGFRLLPDGRPFTFIIEYSADRWTAELELYKEYYEDVGIRTIAKLEDPTLMSQRLTTGEVMAWVHNNPMVPWSPERKAMTDLWTWGQGFGPWSRWAASLQTAMRATLKPGEFLPIDWRLKTPPAGWKAPDNAEEPPQSWKEMATNMDRWQNTDMGTEQYRKMAIDIFNYYVNDWFGWIGAVGEVPTPVISKTKLGNVLKPGWVTGLMVSDLLFETWMDQLYWK